MVLWPSCFCVSWTVSLSVCLCALCMWQYAIVRWGCTATLLLFPLSPITLHHVVQLSLPIPWSYIWKIHDLFPLGIENVLSDFTLLLSSHGYVFVMLSFLHVACQSYNRTFKNSVNSECVSDSQSTAHAEMTKEFVVWPAIRQTAASSCVKPLLLHIQEHLLLTDRQCLLLSAFLAHSTRVQLPRHVKATCEHIRCILWRVPDNTLLSHSICSIPWCFFLASISHHSAHQRYKIKIQLGYLAPGWADFQLYCAAESKCQFILNVHLSFLVTTHLHPHTLLTSIIDVLTGLTTIMGRLLGCCTGFSNQSFQSSIILHNHIITVTLHVYWLKVIHASTSTYLATWLKVSTHKNISCRMAPGPGWQ